VRRNGGLCRGRSRIHRKAQAALRSMTRVSHRG
jgi:hypothetical protein